MFAFLFICYRYLAIKKLSHARTCLSSFCDKLKTNKSDCVVHNTNNVDLYSSSLLNFCQVLILIIEREDTIEQFQQLHQKYEELLVKTDSFLVEVINLQSFI